MNAPTIFFSWPRICTPAYTGPCTNRIDAFSLIGDPIVRPSRSSFFLALLTSVPGWNGAKVYKKKEKTPWFYIELKKGEVCFEDAEGTEYHGQSAAYQSVADGQIQPGRWYYKTRNDKFKSFSRIADLLGTYETLRKHTNQAAAILEAFHIFELGAQEQLVKDKPLSRTRPPRSHIGWIESVRMRVKDRLQEFAATTSHSDTFITPDQAAKFAQRLSLLATDAEDRDIVKAENLVLRCGDWELLLEEVSLHDSVANFAKWKEAAPARYKKAADKLFEQYGAANQELIIAEQVWHENDSKPNLPVKLAFHGFRVPDHVFRDLWLPIEVVFALTPSLVAGTVELLRALSSDQEHNRLSICRGVPAKAVAILLVDRTTSQADRAKLLRMKRQKAVDGTVSMHSPGCHVFLTSNDNRGSRCGSCKSGIFEHRNRSVDAVKTFDTGSTASSKAAMTKRKKTKRALAYDAALPIVERMKTDDDYSLQRSLADVPHAEPNLEPELAPGAVIDELTSYLDSLQPENGPQKPERAVGSRWTVIDLAMAMELLTLCRSRGFQKTRKEMKKAGRSLPGLRTLQALRSIASFTPGKANIEFIVMSIEDFIETHPGVTSFRFVLATDEMSIAEGVAYRRGSKTFVGFVTETIDITLSKIFYAKRVLAGSGSVWYLQAIDEKWSIPVWLSLSAGGNQARDLVNEYVAIQDALYTCFEAIRQRLERPELKLQVLSVTGDRHAKNRDMMHRLASMPSVKVTHRTHKGSRPRSRPKSPETTNDDELSESGTESSRLSSEAPSESSTSSSDSYRPPGRALTQSLFDDGADDEIIYDESYFQELTELAGDQDRGPAPPELAPMELVGPMPGHSGLDSAGQTSTTPVPVAATTVQSSGPHPPQGDRQRMVFAVGLAAVPVESAANSIRRVVLKQLVKLEGVDPMDQLSDDNRRRGALVAGLGEGLVNLIENNFVFNPTEGVNGPLFVLFDPPHSAKTARNQLSRSKGNWKATKHDPESTEKEPILWKTWQDIFFSILAQTKASMRPTEAPVGLDLRSVFPDPKARLSVRRAYAIFDCGTNENLDSGIVYFMSKRTVIKSTIDFTKSMWRIVTFFRRTDTLHGDRLHNALAKLWRGYQWLALWYLSSEAQESISKEWIGDLTATVLSTLYLASTGPIRPKSLDQDTVENHFGITRAAAGGVATASHLTRVKASTLTPGVITKLAAKVAENRKRAKKRPGQDKSQTRDAMSSPDPLRKNKRPRKY